MNATMKKLFCILSAGVLLATIQNIQAQNFWAKQIGGISSDEGSSLVVDAEGNIYATGFFEGTVDFDPGPGVLNLTAAGYSDIFISKLDPFGNLVWVKKLEVYQLIEGLQ